VVYSEPGDSVKEEATKPAQTTSIRQCYRCRAIGQNNASFEMRFLASFNGRYVSIGRSYTFRSDRVHLKSFEQIASLCARLWRTWYDRNADCEDQKIINTKRVLYSITREPAEEKEDAENPVFCAFVNVLETFVKRITPRRYNILTKKRS